MKKLLLSILACIFLIGCNNGLYDKAMKQGELALSNGEFDKALASFEIALNQKPKDEDARKAYESIAAYNEVKMAVDEAKWDDVLSKAENLLKKEQLAGSIKGKLNEYTKLAETNRENHKYVSEKIEDIKRLVNEKKYKDAQTLIDELKNQDKIKSALTSFLEELNSMEIAASDGTKKQKEAEELEAKKKAEAAANASKKKEYIQKLNNIQSGLKDLDYLYSGNMMQMKEAASETYKRWDKALNEIYGVLKTQLSESEMNKLRDKQREWIKYRDNTAKTASLEFEGGSMETLEYTSTLAQLTKERCYELVQNYMQ
jgi:uncharacterized protein YecT (DUF1311 family)